MGVYGLGFRALHGYPDIIGLPDTRGFNMAYPCPSRCLCAFGVPLRVVHSEFFILVKGVRGNGGGRLRFRVSGVVAFQVYLYPQTLHHCRL